MIYMLHKQQSKISTLQHDFISPILVANARVAEKAVPAIEVPWYEHGNVLTYLQQHPSVNKLDLVGLRHLYLSDVTNTALRRPSI
jgi:hypothetical protein